LAMFQPPLMNAVSKVATTWFGDGQRALAITIGSLANPLGCIFGFAVGAIFVTNDDAEDVVVGKQHVL